MAGQRCVQFTENDIGQRRALTVFEDLFSDLGQLHVGVLGDFPQPCEALIDGPSYRPCDRTRPTRTTSATE
ncbi:hypothetical protein ACFWWT_38910 [Streptomyces sp. NPDC058676]|uniref:hypothetical protein n=1 Tax=unclassified Streptomyces TaxID=2593676 RepID=UPI003659DCC8